MNENLRGDNTENNCTVFSDSIYKVGRGHAWQWEHEDSNIRVCSTCGRREFNFRGNDVKNVPEEGPNRERETDSKPNKTRSEQQRDRK